MDNVTCNYWQSFLAGVLITLILGAIAYITYNNLNNSNSVNTSYIVQEMPPIEVNQEIPMQLVA